MKNFLVLGISSEVAKENQYLLAQCFLHAAAQEGRRKQDEEKKVGNGDLGCRWKLPGCTLQ